MSRVRSIASVIGSQFCTGKDSLPDWPTTFPDIVDIVCGFRLNLSRQKANRDNKYATGLSFTIANSHVDRSHTIISQTWDSGLVNKRTTLNGTQLTLNPMWKKTAPHCWLFRNPSKKQKQKKHIIFAELLHIKAINSAFPSQSCRLLE